MYNTLFEQKIWGNASDLQIQIIIKTSLEYFIIRSKRRAEESINVKISLALLIINKTATKLHKNMHIYL